MIIDQIYSLHNFAILLLFTGMQFSTLMDPWQNWKDLKSKEEVNCKLSRFFNPRFLRPFWREITYKLVMKQLLRWPITGWMFCTAKVKWKVYVWIMSFRQGVEWRIYCRILNVCFDLFFNRHLNQIWRKSNSLKMISFLKVKAPL